MLREVVSTVRSRLGYGWVGIRFVEGGELVLGPAVGSAGGAETTVPIRYEGSVVAQLAAVGADPEDGSLLERVATLISAYCLVGWDTGGTAWQP